jgi:ribosomal protein S18 acetylase RimI-like enzyme
MEIKRAQIDDLQVILDLQKLCYTDNALRYNDFKLPPLTQTINDLEKEFDDTVILKAIKQGNIVGSVRAFEKDGTCFIGRLIVHPDFQNKGIGNKLMNELERIFKKAKRFELFTGMRDDKNLYFYQKIGYKPYKQIKIKDDLILVYLEKHNQRMILPSLNKDLK